MQHGFHFNGARCTGCKTCVLACKDYHDLGCDQAFRQVYEYVSGSWSPGGANGLPSGSVAAYYVSLACNHCARPVCVQVCPTGAMHKDENGLVCVDVRRCIGCGYCELSCPYGAPKVDRALGHSVKCDGCASRVAAGLMPVCVEACPLRALDFGPIDELRERFGDLADLAPLPDASHTSPSLVVTPPRNASFERRSADEEGRVGNLREIV